MKTSTTFVLLAFGAASLSAALTLPALAQTFKPRAQTCDNKSTARDKVQRPDQRCVHATSEQYLNEKTLNQYITFKDANPPKTITQGPKPDVHVYDGVDRNGDPYRIVSGPGGFAGSGSASGLHMDYKSGNGGSGGGRGRTSAR
jgi:hypothetical protein